MIVQITTPTPFPMVITVPPYSSLQPCGVHANGSSRASSTVVNGGRSISLIRCLCNIFALSRQTGFIYYEYRRRDRHDLNGRWNLLPNRQQEDVSGNEG